MLKYTLVPESFFSADKARASLESVAVLGENESVRYKELPRYKAVLVYTDGGCDAPDQAADFICELADAASRIEKYNKVVARVGERCVDIVIAEGERLLLCNSFRAEDATTALYFIFASLKGFQINPQVTTLYFFGEVPLRLKSDAARYFSSVEQF